MSPTRRTLAQRRSDAAPLALVLAGWALAVAPVAHPLLAHGVPFLRDAADERWVQHESDPHGQPRAPQRGHSHAPGAPEHLQVPALAAASSPVFRTVMLALAAPPQSERLSATLPRRWSREQPQAP
ncbi:MAG TPA: hypothetical protein VFN91_03970 [Myxococcaceae bacterium]|nr:hypothetical protein [Myxococcaceae bacterium]